MEVYHASRAPDLHDLAIQHDLSPTSTQPRAVSNHGALVVVVGGTERLQPHLVFQRRADQFLVHSPAACKVSW